MLLTVLRNHFSHSCFIGAHKAKSTAQGRFCFESLALCEHERPQITLGLRYRNLRLVHLSQAEVTSSVKIPTCLRLLILQDYKTELMCFPKSNIP